MQLPVAAAHHQPAVLAVHVRASASASASASSTPLCATRRARPTRAHCALRDSGVNLSDLVMTDEGNSDFNDAGLVNFQKLLMVYKSTSTCARVCVWCRATDRRLPTDPTRRWTHAASSHLRDSAVPGHALQSVAVSRAEDVPGDDLAVKRHRRQSVQGARAGCAVCALCVCVARAVCVRPPACEPDRSRYTPYALPTSRSQLSLDREPRNSTKASIKKRSGSMCVRVARRVRRASHRPRPRTCVATLVGC